jgi:hypothetical protein
MPRWDLQVRENRQRAIANGDETYQGSPCKHGHPGIRLVRYNGKCLDCHKAINHYYRNNHEKATAKRRSNPRELLWQAARQRARTLGREFTISREDITIPTHCPISGRPMKVCSPDAPSLDRIDNSRGYTPDNIAVISKRMNTAKSNLTLADVDALARFMRGFELLK